MDKATTTTMTMSDSPVPQEDTATTNASNTNVDTTTTMTTTTTSSGCCAWTRFDGNVMAQGYNVHGMGRGPIYMCTVLLSTAFIYLASDKVGCVDMQGKIVDDCEERVYGAFRPAALVTNIATISGVLVALFLPLIGAIMDYTPHRKTVGVVTAILMILTEAIQIGTTSQTWFGMALLEAFSGLLFETQIIASLAYLPDLAKTVGDETMNTYTAKFIMVEVALGQALYMFVVIAVATALGLGDVATARVGQGIVTVWAGLGFYLGWKKLPHVPAKHSLLLQQEEEEQPEQPNDNNPEDEKEEGKEMDTTTKQQPQQQKKKHNLFLIGFIQNWHTFQRINREYKHSIRWFLLACVFGEAAATAFLTVAVIVLTEEWGLDATQVGLFFIVGLVGIVLGCWPGEWICRRTNPNTSWRLAMLYTFVVSVIGALTVNKDNAIPSSFVWGFAVSLGLGWHYQAEYVYVALITPKDQEAELAGFFNYCRIILSWLPPLLFSLLVEANVSQSIGIITTNCFFLLAIAALCMSAPWEQVLEEVHGGSNHKNKEDNNKTATIVVETTKGEDAQDDNDVVKEASEPQENSTMDVENGAPTMAAE
ncbi:expressed unknown protein [Seminavis robusta]|uniref:Uncharacterized protein n=1 Tax=Seminavis robusta TaxID=568900 RepID=A0A9N8DJE5_9STRA|nr:expressed unknown protein [Seminavis robusta]|eukprot:Sro92_g048080.1 n/a (593) ;mRNA; f:44314-46092